MVRLKKILIFGVSVLAKQLYEWLVEDNYPVEAFVIDEKYKPEQDQFCGKPIVYTASLLRDFPVDQYNIIIAIGYNKMNSGRREKYLQLKKMGYNIIGYKHPTALVLADDIGDGNIFFENVTVGKHAKIGNGNIFRPCCLLAHDAIVNDFNFFAISCSIAGNVKIGSNCFFGNNCTVKNEIKIDDYTLVGAGCYLSKDTPTLNSVYVPARSILLEGKNSLDML